TRASVDNCSRRAGNIGRDSGELTTDRSNWDDVDDYNDFPTETDTFKDQENNSFTMTGYIRSVTIEYIPSDSDPIEAANPAGATTQSSSTDTKRIVVSVTSPLNETFNFVAVSCNF
ncbi:MAG: hypothetical protein U9R66_05125, partial [Thermodesulfobacteriota bacterium]|nr:hypothetical protein [Thermodesulfobacteriota bacterium]